MVINVDFNIVCRKCMAKLIVVTKGIEACKGVTRKFQVIRTKCKNSQIYLLTFYITHLCTVNIRWYTCGRLL